MVPAPPQLQSQAVATNQNPLLSYDGGFFYVAVFFYRISKPLTCSDYSGSIEHDTNMRRNSFTIRRFAARL
jgi:hypothetical protein